jgi:hypothetical protein
MVDYDTNNKEHTPSQIYGINKQTKGDGMFQRLDTKMPTKK